MPDGEKDDEERRRGTPVSGQFFPRKDMTTPAFESIGYN